MTRALVIVFGTLRSFGFTDQMSFGKEYSGRRPIRDQ